MAQVQKMGPIQTPPFQSMPQFPLLPPRITNDMERMLNERIDTMINHKFSNPTETIKEKMEDQVKEIVLAKSFLKKLHNKLELIEDDDDIVEEKLEESEENCPFEKLFCTLKEYHKENKPFYEVEEELFKEHEDLTDEEKRIFSAFLRSNFPSMVGMEVESFFETLKSLGSKL